MKKSYLKGKNIEWWKVGQTKRDSIETIDIFLQLS